MTLHERLSAIVAPLPAGASVTLPAEALRVWLEEEPALAGPVQTPAPGPPSSWRERLWTVPAETRLGVAEASEALGRSRSWVYKQTSAGTVELPFRKMGAELLFLAGELRSWIREHEEDHGGASEGTPADRAPWATSPGGRRG